MRKQFALTVLTFFLLGLSSSMSQSSWDSIDAREVPAWWKDAKFGIFIHSGP